MLVLLMIGSLVVGLVVNFLLVCFCDNLCCLFKLKSIKVILFKNFINIFLINNFIYWNLEEFVVFLILLIV